MTIYDLINWKVENATVTAEFRSSICNAVKAAKQGKDELTSYFLHELESKRRMFNAMLGYCNDERRISYDDVDRICCQIWRLYRKAMRESNQVETA